jgi:hypothetical protein
MMITLITILFTLDLKDKEDNMSLNTEQKVCQHDYMKSCSYL